MNYKHLVHLVYNCHNMPEGRKDAVAVKLSNVVTRTNYRVWKQLLVSGLAVKEEFFRAYAPSHKTKILETLCGAMRKIKRIGKQAELYDILDDVYCQDNREIPEGETASFFRSTLRQSSEKGVRAMLAALIMELPEQYHRVEEVAAAIHGDYLLSIRAIERLCDFGEPGLKVLYQLVDEISLTPAITFTLFRIIDNTKCRGSLKRTIAAKVFLSANQRDPNNKNPLAPPRSDTEIRMMRSAHVARGLQSTSTITGSDLDKGLRRRGRKDPVFLRFTATRKIKMEREGGFHVSKKDYSDASLRTGLTPYPGDLGKERLRLSIQLRNKGLPTHL